MNLKKIIYPCALAVCFASVFGFGIWFGVTKIAYHVPQPGSIDFSLFWDAYNTLQQKFIDPSKITNQKVLYGAIDGMAKSLGDPYTNFFDPAEAQRFQQDLSGSFEGIGVVIGVKKNMLTVIAPIKNTPGQKAGLLSGDTIVKINGKDSIDMIPEDAVNLIRGTKGTAVTLTVLRDGWNIARDFTIIRDTINVPLVEWSLKDKDVAYVQITQFDESLPVDFKAAALQILQSPAKKIVLDLRDNPGGYLEVAQEIAGWFLQSGKIVTIEDSGKGKPQQTFLTQGNSSFANYPMVVLMNQGSASASEILAGALRDNRNIKLIGTRSFGKGSVQEVVNLHGGSFLKITVAHWLTPKGASISDVGLSPDVSAELTEQDIQSGKDPQLDKALEIINALQ